MFATTYKPKIVRKWED